MFSAGRSVPAFGLPENDGEASTAEAEALPHGTGDGYFGAVCGNTEVLTENPHLTGSVVHLIDAASERPEGSCHPSSNADFPVHESSGVPINFLSMLVRGQPVRMTVEITTEAANQRELVFTKFPPLS